MSLPIDPSIREYTARMLTHRPRPPLSSMDTLCAAPDGHLTSVHGDTKVFDDGDIIAIYPPVDEKILGEQFDWSTQESTFITSSLSQFGKWTLQQQGTRNCTAAFNMFLLDHGKPVNLQSLKTWNCRNLKRAAEALSEAGLHITQRRIGRRDIETLAAHVDSLGSALISIDLPSGTHVIIVDQFFDDGVLIREPYHGCQMGITHGALERHLCNSEVIQVS